MKLPLPTELLTSVEPSVSAEERFPGVDGGVPRSACVECADLRLNSELDFLILVVSLAASPSE